MEELGRKRFEAICLRQGIEGEGLKKSGLEVAVE
jgi:hypothetical protein